MTELFLFFCVVMVIVNRISISGLQNKISSLEEKLKNAGPLPTKTPFEPNPEIKPEPVKTAAALQPKSAQETKPEVIVPVKPAEATAPAPQPFAAPQTPAAPPEPAGPSWFENLTAAKIFSWLGGFALFLGMVFFIKYSIDTNLLTPPARVILSCILGVALIAAGYFITDKKYAVTAGTLCGSGAAVLYAAIFAGYSFYHLIPVEWAFAFMAAVSLFSFWLAVLKDAKYIAYLGVIISFLTPVLLSTGVDRPFVLFGFIAVVNAGALAVAVRKSWEGIIKFSLCVTFFMQLGWYAKYFELYKTNTLCVIFALYAAAAAFVIYKFENALKEGAKKLFGLYIAANMLFPFFILARFDAGPTAHLIKILTFALLVNVISAALFVRAPREQKTNFILSGALAFLGLLFLRQAASQTAVILFSYLVFAAVNGCAGMFFPRTKTESGGWFETAAPVLFIGLILFRCTDASLWLLMPFMFLLLGLAAFRAVSSGKYAAAFFAAALCTLVFVVFISKAPTGFDMGLPMYSSFVMTLVLAAGLFFTKKIDGNETGQQFIITVSIMPFVLLFTALAKLDNPSGIYLVYSFSVAALLAAFAMWFKKYAAALAAAGGLLAVQAAFIFTKTNNVNVMVWLGISVLLFTALPFLVKEREENNLLWAGAGIYPAAAFFLMYYVLRTVWNPAHPGVLALGFAAVYGALSVYLYSEDKTKKTRLAFIGGAALLFITAFFPMELSKNWLTVAFAFEGMALAWLARKIDLDAVEKVGFAFLAAAFARLALNPFVLGYYPSGTKIFNWYLYTYGLSAAACFCAAYFMRVKELAGAARLFGLIILFALMNLEIADWYSTTVYLNFDIFGSFAVTVTYTLAWALFGLATLASGLLTENKAARYIGIGLVGVATAKLFLSDIWQLATLYRVIALIGMAVILIVVSLFYQKLKKAD